MQLLVVENSEPIHRLIEGCLRKYDCEITRSAIPHDLGRLSDLPEAEAVFVGAYQPFRWAIGVIEHYAGHRLRPSIVALTPEPQAAERAQLLTAGAHYVIEMPFRSHVIQKVLERVVQDRQRAGWLHPD